MSFEIAIGPNIRKSPYFDKVVQAGVRSFSVYNHMYIPGHFGDPDAEYDRLVQGVAIWDVAAQRQVEIAGPDAARLVQYLTPRDLGGTRVGQGRYIPLCDAEGFLINDPVLLKLAADRFWLSVADSDIVLWAAGMALGKGWDVRVTEPDVSPLAIQGPLAVDVAAALFGDQVREMRYFAFHQTALGGIPLLLARSGWSKQGGFEMYLQDSAQGGALWDRVMAAGAPFGIGPGAPNDIERLESGLISYGADMRRQTQPATPFEMGLGAMVDLAAGHDFVGRAALAELAGQPVARRRVGLILEGRPTPPGHPVPLLAGGVAVGHLFECAWSRRLGQCIGAGLVASAQAAPGTVLQVALPGGDVPARVVALPFIR